MKKHSSVYYIYKEESGFIPVKKAKTYINDFNLDLFVYDGSIYEGQSGARMCSAGTNINIIIKSSGNMEKIQNHVQKYLAKYGESPRYTRPDEKKKDIFQSEKNEDIVFAKDVYGKKHYYYRFYNENGVELFTPYRAKDMYRTLFFQYEGYMLGISPQQKFEDVIKWFENGVKSEIERLFNEGMAVSVKLAVIGNASGA